MILRKFIVTAVPLYFFVAHLAYAATSCIKKTVTGYTSIPCTSQRPLQSSSGNNVVVGTASMCPVIVNGASVNVPCSSIHQTQDSSSRKDMPERARLRNAANARHLAQ